MGVNRDAPRSDNQWMRLPDDPSPSEMLTWIAGRYSMSKADLARMFQTTQSTIHYWMRTDRISYRNLRKLRASFYYLHNAADPHAGERRCQSCLLWKDAGEYRDGKAICRGCENRKTLEAYWRHREETLERRRARAGGRQRRPSAAG